MTEKKVPNNKNEILKLINNKSHIILWLYLFYLILKIMNIF